MLAKKELPTESSPYMTVGRIEEGGFFTAYKGMDRKKKKGKDAKEKTAQNDENTKDEQQES